MRLFFLHHRKLISFFGILIVAGAGYMSFKVITYNPLSWIVTTTVETGTVENVVSVSGLMDAKGTAELAFPSSGVVSKVYFKEGDAVKDGDVIATLASESLVAERAGALAELRLAEADRDELVSGVRSEEKNITNTTVTIAENELAKITATENQTVENAKRILLSSELSALSTEVTNEASAPAISGTYRCDQAGTYTLKIYNSGAKSGYSIRLDGLESGIFEASVDQPAPLGTCGLFAKMTAGAQYTNTTWTIEIPNSHASSYTTNKNNYELTKITAKTAISAAEEKLLLAKQEQGLQNAAPRSEALARANALIKKAQATIAQIDARIGDKSVIAPFAGIVMRVGILAGETAATSPVFTLLATDSFELIARIPEIDITKIAIGQKARVVFDAQAAEMQTATVNYISLLPIQIDGVAYFEVKLKLDKNPAWLRGGLNADVDIIIDGRENVLRIPKRYLTNTDQSASVRVLTNKNIATTTVISTFSGNDGYVAIEGLPAGTIVVAP